VTTSGGDEARRRSASPQTAQPNGTPNVIACGAVHDEPFLRRELAVPIRHKRLAHQSAAAQRFDVGLSKPPRPSARHHEIAGAADFVIELEIRFTPRGRNLRRTVTRDPSGSAPTPAAAPAL
jgi:hypothetical protein